MRGPCVLIGAASRSSTTCTACGLPIDTAVICTLEPPTSRDCTAAAESLTNGMRLGSNSGAPMLTVTAPGAGRRGDQPGLGLDADLVLRAQPLVAHEAH